MPPGPPLTAQQLDSRLKRHFLGAEGLGNLNVVDFVPGTGIGKFDAHYLPSQHRLNIKVNFRYDWVQDLTKPEELPWPALDKTAFRNAAKPLIEDSWSGCYKLSCIKPGWTNFYADVHIDFNEVPTGQEAYIVSVKKLALPLSSGGINHGVVPHVCGVNNWANEIDQTKKVDQIFNYKEGLLRNTLRGYGPAGKDGDFIPFDRNSRVLTQNMKLLLTKWANYVQAKRTPDIVGVRAYLIGFTGNTDSGIHFGMAKDRAKAVRDYLNNKVGGDPPFSLLPSSGESNQSWATDAKRILKARAVNPSNSNGGVLIVIRTPVGEVREVPRRYVVMKHEFGHMIGLPDEYMGVVSVKTKTKMELDHVIPTTYIASSLSTGGDVVRLGNMQGAMIDDLNTADVEAPLFMGTVGTATPELQKERADRVEQWYQDRAAAKAKHGGTNDSRGYKKWKRKNPEPPPVDSLQMISSSVMHSGGDILPAHYITIWSALCSCTNGFIAPNEWKIVPA